MWSFLSRNRDAGILFLRVALGIVFIWAHGWQKITGGPEAWTKLGLAMKNVGISFWPMFWGFMAMLSETLGIVLMMIGLAFRPACLLLVCTMTVATLTIWGSKSPAQPMELGIVFLALVFIGPGKYSVDKN